MLCECGRRKRNVCDEEKREEGGGVHRGEREEEEEEGGTQQHEKIKRLEGRWRERGREREQLHSRRV